MPPRRRQAAAVSREEKVERLQAAAITVIARHGVTEASTRAIATEAGLNLAAVHYAFDGKDDLLTSLLERVLADTSRLITAVAQDCENAQEAIARMAQAYWEHTIHNPDLQRVNFELGLYTLTNTEYRERSQQQFSALHDHVASLFQHFLPQWSKEQVAVLTVACISTMEGLAMQFLVMQNQATCEQALALNIKALQLLCEQPPSPAG
jgi:AcrR family transcriptional regulator